MAPSVAATRTPEEQAAHHRHVKTAKRVGIGAAGSYRPSRTIYSNLVQVYVK